MERVVQTKSSARLSAQNLTTTVAAGSHVQIAPNSAFNFTKSWDDLGFSLSDPYYFQLNNSIPDNMKFRMDILLEGTVTGGLPPALWISSPAIASWDIGMEDVSAHTANGFTKFWTSPIWRTADQFNNQLKTELIFYNPAANTSVFTFTDLAIGFHLVE